MILERPEEPGKKYALAFTFVVHAGLILALFLGVQWKRSPPEAMEVTEVELWSSRPTPATQVLPPPPPEVKPEPPKPVPKVEPKPEPLPPKQPDIVTKEEKKPPKPELKKPEAKPEEKPEEEAVEQKKIKEVRKWKKSAINSYQQGKPFKEFTAYYLEPEVVEDIEANLKYVSEREDINEIFNPYIDGRYDSIMRLKTLHEEIRKITNA